ncbi:FAD:protein FMN transferase [Reinekea forsetii]|nr:FAD:protein FMN transferase [Reinekea forsetii]
MFKHNHQFVAMGGPCAIYFWHHSKQADEIKRTLEQEVRRLEFKFSRFKATSLVSQINRGEHNGSSLDDETTALLNYAQQCFEISDGLFDITVGSFREIWDFKSGKTPNESEILTVKNKVGWHKVGWNGQCVNLLKGTELDFGGLVKEFAADRLVALLQEHQATGLVNLAGDIAVTGRQVEGQPWPISIVHPRAKGKVIATVNLEGGAIACSGDYERFMYINGKRYHHLINPLTGWPDTESLASVSVITQNCIMAGSITTIAMLKGERAKEWLDEIALPYLAIRKDCSIFGSIEV